MVKDVHAEQMHALTEQHKKEIKEKSKQETKVKKGKKKVKTEESEASQNITSKFYDKEREIHEAYQVLLGEYLKRKQQRKREARMIAIRETEAAESRLSKSPKTPQKSNKDISNFLKVIFVKTN